MLQKDFSLITPKLEVEFIFKAIETVISPLRLGFTGTLKVIRRAIADFQDANGEQLPFFSPN